MTQMGTYCKAYSIQRFREFPHWTEQTENARSETQIMEGQEIETPRQLTEESFLYLQTNFVVTDGIFMDEHIIFDTITPAWEEFCYNTLGFEIPDQVRSSMQSAQTA